MLKGRAAANATVITILVAEDNEDDVFLIKRAFSTLGLTYPVQVCSDGEETIAYLKGQRNYEDRVKYPFPRILFLDLKMPRMDGFDVLRWLKKHPRCAVIPTIVLTSSKETKDVERAYELGANAYLVKPGRFDEFREMLKTTCEFWALCEMPESPPSC